MSGTRKNRYWVAVGITREWELRVRVPSLVGKRLFALRYSLPRGNYRFIMQVPR